MPLLRRDVDGVGCNDLADLRNACQALQATAGEDAMRANNLDVLDSLLDENMAQFMDRTACGNLIIVDERTTMSLHLIPDQGVDLHFGIGNAFLVSGSDGQPENIRKT